MLGRHPGTGRDVALRIHHVEVQHMLNAVIGVVIQEFIQPHQRVFVGLTNAAEISGDCGWPAQVWIRPIGAFGVQRFNKGCADDIQCGDNGGQVAVSLWILSSCARRYIAPA